MKLSPRRGVVEFRQTTRIPGAVTKAVDPLLLFYEETATEV
jgi:hypothetical protein